jgi:hypothetical protein
MEPVPVMQTTGITGLLIFQGVTAKGPDIPFNIHPKSQNEINNKRRAHSKKRNIYEPGTNA